MFATATLAVSNASGAYVTGAMVAAALAVDIVWAVVAFKFVEEN